MVIDPSSFNPRGACEFRARAYYPDNLINDVIQALEVMGLSSDQIAKVERELPDLIAQVSDTGSHDLARQALFKQIDEKLHVMVKERFPRHQSMEHAYLQADARKLADEISHQAEHPSAPHVNGAGGSTGARVSALVNGGLATMFAVGAARQLMEARTTDEQGNVKWHMTPLMLGAVQVMLAGVLAHQSYQGFRR